MARMPKRKTRKRDCGCGGGCGRSADRRPRLAFGRDNNEELFMDLVPAHVAENPDRFAEWLRENECDEGPVLLLDPAEARATREGLCGYLLLATGKAVSG